MKHPFERSWWVKDGLLLAGCYPGGHEENVTRGKLQGLLDVGVRYVISLQEEGEMSHWGVPFAPYHHTLKELADEMGVEIDWANFPIRDMDVPKPGLMENILAAIDKAHQQDTCVYVHCWGGHGRTGTVIGCWLRRNGLSGDEAIDYMAHLRSHDPHLVDWDAPQTRDQCNMIHSWGDM